LNDFPKNLRVQREVHGWTQQDLAKRSGVAQSSISAYENGEAAPTVPAVWGLADALAISIDWLVGRSDAYRVIQDQRDEALGRVAELEEALMHISGKARSALNLSDKP
jgi:transcriptional regulator with XRE-family HTH domain